MSHRNAAGDTHGQVSSRKLAEALGEASRFLRSLTELRGAPYLLITLLAAVTLPSLALIHVCAVGLPGSGLATFAHAVGLVVYSLLMSAIEEIVYRGWLLPRLMRRMPFGAANFLQSLLFTAVHGLLADLGAVHYLSLFGLGLMFGVVWRRTGTIAAAWAFHVLCNAVILLGYALHFGWLVRWDCSESTISIRFGALGLTLAALLHLCWVASSISPSRNPPAIAGHQEESQDEIASIG